MLNILFLILCVVPRIQVYLFRALTLIDDAELYFQLISFSLGMEKTRSCFPNFKHLAFSRPFPVA